MTARSGGAHKSKEKENGYKSAGNPFATVDIEKL